MASTVFDFSSLVPEGAPNPCVIQDTAARGISLGQLLDIVALLLRLCGDDGTIPGARSSYTKADGTIVDVELNVHSLNLYQLVSWMVKPATAVAKCSYVELVSFTAANQMPTWFVSHYWGEPVTHFAACLQHFVQHRACESVFWVCAYANSQHDLAAEVTSDPADSSFARALRHCRGTLMVVDENGTPFWRVWCTFEIFMTLEAPNHTFDLVTFDFKRKWQDLRVPTFVDGQLLVHGGHVAMISEGHLPVDERAATGDVDAELAAAESKAQREVLSPDTAFPVKVLTRSLNISVQNAQATVEADRVHILNSITGSSDLDAEPRAEHVAYECINFTLRTRFASLLLVYHIWAKNMVEIRRALGHIATDTASKHLTFSLVGSPISSEVLSGLAESLPLGLHGLTLDLRYTNHLSVKSIAEMLSRITSMVELTSLSLSFAGFSHLGDRGFAPLEQACTLASMTKLRLDLSRCGRLTGCTAKYLASLVTGMPVLEDFALDLWRCDGIPEEGLANLCESMAKKPMKVLYLRLGSSACGSEWLQPLFGCLRDFSSLRKLALDVGTPLKLETLRQLGEALASLESVDELKLGVSAARDYLETSGAGTSPARGRPLLTDVALDALAGAFEKMTQLVSLRIRLMQFRHLEETSFHSTLKSVARLPMLRKLKVFFGSCSIGDEGAKVLSSSLENCLQLQDLSLHFEYCWLADAGTRALAGAIFKLEALREFAFKCPKCCVSDSSIGAVVENLAFLEQLKSLRLDCSELHQFSDRGCKAIFDVVPHLQHVEFLSVLARGCWNIGQPTIDSLAKQLPLMPSLQEAIIDLSHSGADGDGWLDIQGLKSTLEPAFAVSKDGLRMCIRKGRPVAARGRGLVGKGHKGGKGKHGKGSADFRYIVEARQRELRQIVYDYVTDVASGSPKDAFKFDAADLSPDERRFVHHLVADVKGFVTQAFGEGEDRTLSIIPDASAPGHLSEPLPLSVTAPRLPEGAFSWRRTGSGDSANGSFAAVGKSRSGKGKSKGHSAGAAETPSPSRGVGSPMTPFGPAGFGSTSPSSGTGRRGRRSSGQP